MIEKKPSNNPPVNNLRLKKTWIFCWAVNIFILGFLQWASSRKWLPCLISRGTLGGAWHLIWFAEGSFWRLFYYEEPSHNQHPVAWKSLNSLPTIIQYHGHCLENSNVFQSAYVMVDHLPLYPFLWICQTFKNGACDPNVDISSLRLLKSFHISCIYSNFPKDYDVFVNRIYTMYVFGTWKD